MPQLDITTYTITNITLLLAFWIYFSTLYIAVSYTMQKVYVSVYFKFYTILISLISVLSVMEEYEVVSEMEETGYEYSAELQDDCHASVKSTGMDK